MKNENKWTELKIYVNKDVRTGKEGWMDAEQNQDTRKKWTVWCTASCRNPCTARNTCTAIETHVQLETYVQMINLNGEPKSHSPADTVGSSSIQITI